MSGLQGSPSRPREPSCASHPRGPRGCWSGSPCAGRGQGRRLEPERTWVRVSTGRVPGPAPLLPPQAREGPPVLAQPSEPATPTPGGPRGQALRPEGAGAVAPGACWGSPEARRAQLPLSVHAPRAVPRPHTPAPSPMLTAPSAQAAAGSHAPEACGPRRQPPTPVCPARTRAWTGRPVSTDTRAGTTPRYLLTDTHRPQGDAAAKDLLGGTASPSPSGLAPVQYEDLLPCTHAPARQPWSGAGRPRPSPPPRGAARQRRDRPGLEDRPADPGRGWHGSGPGPKWQ